MCEDEDGLNNEPGQKERKEPWMTALAPPKLTPGATETILATQAVRGHLVRTITADTIDNLDQLIPILKNCPNLHTLSVSRWRRDHEIFRDLCTLAPKLEVLRVSFFLTVDMNSFFQNVSGALATSLSDLSTGTLSSDGTFQATFQEPMFRRLKTLNIKHHVPDTNTVRWNVLKAALDRLPALQSLFLTGFGFRRSRDHQGGLIFEQDVDEHLLDNGHQRMEREWLRSHRSYPQMRTLSLFKGQCSKMNMLDLDRIFPMLTSLEVRHCELDWIEALEPLDEDTPPDLTPSVSSLPISVPSSSSSLVSSLSAPLPSTQPLMDLSETNKVTWTGARRVPFFDLQQLTIMALEESGSRDLIPDLIKSRPRLTCINTRLITLSVDKLMDMESACTREGRFLESCGIQPPWLDSNRISPLEKWYQAPFLSKLRHLYIQQDISSTVTFGSTLSSLHIGQGYQHDCTFENDVVPYWNSILRALPNLQILKLDRYLRNFLLFEGLGRAPPKLHKTSASSLSSESSHRCSESDKEWHIGDDETKSEVHDCNLERPFLMEISIALRLSPPESTLPSPAPASLSATPPSPPMSPMPSGTPTRSQPLGVETADLDRDLIGRFRFLEKLHIQYVRRPENFEAWKRTWRPGLEVMFRERPFGQYV
ncbi:hypothetical protein EMPS_01582 [Entomortierella parvispora]|uniref:Uncharacterized protein n=1 Tax=Entomortierella parvispora TaxID=205924 RepID=A0A9P3LSP4_9FUNG|nr:hypothetical protein EMPS_01582 [Entomortierella parvispora]